MRAALGEPCPMRVVSSRVVTPGILATVVAAWCRKSWTCKSGTPNHVGGHAPRLRQCGTAKRTSTGTGEHDASGTFIGKLVGALP